LASCIFDSLIYGGYDFPADGIGNHLSLIDRLIFDAAPPRYKSLHALPTQASTIAPYGKVPAFDHFRQPDRYKNCLYLDIARDMGTAQLIEAAAQRAIDYKHGYNAVTGLYLMWESNRLNQAVLRLAQSFDFVIVTSRILDEDLERAGLDWVYLPHPYDFATATGARERVHGDPLVFGVSSGLWPRKNVALLAENFAATFGDDPGVRLVIHTRFNPDHDDYRGEADRLQVVLTQHPNIVLNPRHFTREEYIQWMSSLDVYCFASSGEGYSVTPREALHLGKPVILLDAHVHSEFSHLPGVVPVHSNGMQPATTNHSALDADIGENWKVDEDSLRAALVHVRSEYDRLRQQLVDGMGQVLAFHDIPTIRSQWLSALNDRYRCHIDRVCRQLPPGIAAERDRLMPDYTFTDDGVVTELSMDRLRIQTGTGELSGNVVYCFRSQHGCGHCIYGQNHAPRSVRRMRAEFSIRLIDSDDAAVQFGAPLVSLDVYDNRGESMLAFRELRDGDFGLGISQLALEFDVEPDQVLEFRVYWHRNCDISVHGVSIGPAG